MIVVLLLLAGLCGAAGIALSAASAHYPGGTGLSAAAQMLLMHAPAFLAFASLARLRALPSTLLSIAVALMATGLVIFAGDLSRRVFSGVRLFPWAAPLGGSMMIGGWLWLALCGVIFAVKRNKAD